MARAARRASGHRLRSFGPAGGRRDLRMTAFGRCRSGGGMRSGGEEEKEKI
jgi:hypothetical protein